MNHSLRRIGAVGVLCLPLASVALFHISPARTAEPHHTVVPADTVQWGAAPPSLPPGAQAAVLLGNPAQEGPFVLRLKFPAGFTVPPLRRYATRGGGLSRRLLPVTVSAAVTA